MAVKKQTEESETVDKTQLADTSQPAVDQTGQGGDRSDNGSEPVETFDPSGAPVQIVSDVDPFHPAVDNDPRANTTAEQNRIDFNDPTISGAEAVQRNLDAQAQG